MPLRPANLKASKLPASLLPALELQTPLPNPKVAHKDVQNLAMAIERPRSALHAGDFTKDAQEGQPSPRNAAHPGMSATFSSPEGPLGTSPTTPWYTPTSSLKDIHSFHASSRGNDYGDLSGRRPLRDRAPSLASSFSSSSYILKAPTTPLVQQSNHTDLDLSARDRSLSPDKASRRHTLPPHALQSLHARASSPSSAAVLRQQSQPYRPTHQREGSFPYGHRARRSLTSNWTLQQTSSPATPGFVRSRRTSFSSEISPLQHASMVGSYEESILRGRMSTAPSKPLNFTAQIGVLGKGNCKPKCPAHVTVPFPAVYYSWGPGNGRRPVNDEPSPYVGHIDLQHSSSRAMSRSSIDNPTETSSIDKEEQDSTPGSAILSTFESHLESGRPRKRKRAAVNGPPDGSYRIPEQGQLQIIIKNPNKTAVKLFLVPYDMTGMEAGTKTFIRQRLYSAGPILEKPLASTSEPKTSSPFTVQSKSTLRYLVHLNICCPSKGRFYLYQQIRVVFANRVPDNKEQLRTETQVPEPKFSTWRPSSTSRQSSSAGAKLTAEKAFRRRSSGFGFGDELSAPWPSTSFGGGSTYSAFAGDDTTPPVPPIPFNLPLRKDPSTSDIVNDENDAMDIDTSRPTSASDLASPQSTGITQTFHRTSSQSSSDYEKLNRWDSGYGGVFGRPGTPEPGEGLLARRLKSLGVQRDSSDGGFGPEL